MKTQKIKSNVEAVEFDSLGEFYEYLIHTPFNDAFKHARHSSIEGTYSFTKTESFDEAVQLFKNGWSDMAQKLVQKLKVIENKSQPVMKPRNTLGVAGYQAIVPLYLQGAPNSMMSKKMVPIKQKVVTINKSIDYAANVGSDTIIEESIKALQIIKKLEAQGYRVNLNIVLGSRDSNNMKFVMKVRIKSANEKLNVSKLAFPLVHPSMLRRLFFRFIEVYPNITKSFVSHGYGYPSTSSELKQMFKDEYLLPNFIKDDVNSITSIDDLKSV